MPRRRHAWCVAGLVWAAAALVAAVPVPDEEVLASLLDGDEQQTAGEWVLACADTCVPGLRAVRTGPRVPASCVLHVLEAQGSLPRGRHHAVRAPASGVLHVPRTVAPQVLAEQMQRGQLMGHERAEAMDEMSLLQLGLSAMPRALLQRPRALHRWTYRTTRCA